MLNALIPKYGNYGGPGFSGEDENGIPYSLEPYDKLDELFMQHDRDYDAAKNSYDPAKYLIADLVLIKRMKELDPGLLDSEGQRYRIAAIRLFESKVWVTPFIPPTNPYDTRRCHPTYTQAKSWRPVPSDPFIIDLDGDGIETINVTSGIRFDNNADGVKTGTGWVKSDDGLLVRDLNRGSIGVSSP